MRNVLLNTFGDEIEVAKFRDQVGDGVPAFQVEHADYRFLILRGYQEHDQNNALQAISHWAGRNGVDVLADYTRLADHVYFVPLRTPIPDPDEPAGALPDVTRGIGEVSFTVEHRLVVELRIVVPPAIGQKVGVLEVGGPGSLPLVVKRVVDFYLDRHPGSRPDIVMEATCRRSGGDIRMLSVAVVRVYDRLLDSPVGEADEERFWMESAPLVARLRDEGYEFEMFFVGRRTLR